ncbi:hypothetical protein ABZ590_12750 [Streptomyces hirsutus]|uniref:hypothetical protein n=1 Tax=Streptomyces hirsutus TaxID=35620 RepID=UPI0033FB752F
MRTERDLGPTYINSLVNSGYVAKSSSKAFGELAHGAKAPLDGMGDCLTMAADKFEQIDDELAEAARSE